MNNTEIITKLREIYSDLDKILDTADEGRVPVWYDDNGNPTQRFQSLYTPPIQ